jgi:uracil-DNA glycosylase family 4
MATAELIRAYLEWQSEMGTEEVLLPHPMVKKAAAKPNPSAAPLGAPDPADTVRPGAAPIPSSSASSAPAARESAPADLYQSLTQALEKAADGKRAYSGSTGAPDISGRAPSVRPAEALNLPEFGNLEDFWSHVESRPGLLQGELSSSGAESASPGATRVIRGAGPVRAPLALVGFEPGEADASQSRPFSGEAGALLEKMMRAIRLDLGGLYLTHLIKIPVPGKAWSRRELSRILPLLHCELGLAQAPMVLLLGQECAQTVLKTGKTLDELRQETHRMEGREFFVTHHPLELLRKEELKRKAWEDLQWLQRRMAPGQGQERP